MPTTQERDVPADSLEVRARLVDALRLDLVGPCLGKGDPEERFRYFERPSNWYLTGYLIPAATKAEQRTADDDEGDDENEVPEKAGLSEESADERKAKKQSFLPSSMGISFLVSEHTSKLTVLARWGDYEHAEVRKDEDDEEKSDDAKIEEVWQRIPREARIELELNSDGKPHEIQIPDADGLELHAFCRPVQAERLEGYLPKGTRSVSLFFVNRREPNEEDPDLRYAFQAELEVQSEDSLVPRPDLRGIDAQEWDELVADLHYADTPAFATGHGVSVDWEQADGACRRAWTTWVPEAAVDKTVTAKVPSVELGMDELGQLQDADAVHRALDPLVAEYRAWIDAKQGDVAKLQGKRRETGQQLLANATFAANRIENGIQALAADADALDAFRVANRAISSALCKRLDITGPKWKAFQLAFLLLNLRGLIDPKDKRREIVDLLFFPTGGGKTEAYLGLAAFAMVLRRLRNPGDDGRAGAGVSVIMRYTLRLLTLDQLTRAAGLVCALELERSEDVSRYGSWPFEIGLWVGKAATPNHMGRKGDGRSDSARTKTKQYKDKPREKPSPIPIEACPWCNTDFKPDSFSLLDDDGRANTDFPTQLQVQCANFECEFARRGLPIVAVDEPMFRRLPAFLISTVDKFASLPWIGESGALLGGAERFDRTGFYGHAEPKQGKKLQTPLLPPDLVIQDELHLISGPLGTMAGLYEAGIEALCTRMVDGQQVRPKIVASTATVRRAQEQIQALFGHAQTNIFPPPGPDRADSFFAQTTPPPEYPARNYLGVAAPGRNPKVVMRRVYLALMGAAEKAYRDAGGHQNEDNPADPYMTVLGYFNSLRELGGARRIIEEEVRNTVQKYGMRRRLGEKYGLFQNRKKFTEVVELTSRVSTDKVKVARAKLERQFHEFDRLDCAIATNMISVGLDVPRLGLMVVFGQPKTSSEYIQATSRVGRDDRRPGLVVTVLNVHRPRDRSHYERFRAYHESFYRSVEVASVTPFSPRALDRGLAGAMIGFARHAARELAPARGASRLQDIREELERRLLDCYLARIQSQPIDDEDEREERKRSVQNRIGRLLEVWNGVVTQYAADNVQTQYQRYEDRGANAPKPLLKEMLETEFDFEEQKELRVNRSLRDVEPSVNLFLKELSRSAIQETQS